MKFSELSLSSLREGLNNRDFLSHDLVAGCIEQAQSKKDLNCFIDLPEDQILKRADWADQHIVSGHKTPLLGVPVAVKDAILVEGMLATAGSKMLENFQAPYTATCVTKLLEAGAVVFGKTNMDEFAMGSSNENSAFGPVRNPWNKNLVPGGSSGGSAAAVAAGICPVALGTDTGGSIRQPASFCGVVGFKPTYGRVSRYGVIAFASSLDQVGVFAKRVEDCAQVLEVLSGHDSRDSTSVQMDVAEYSKNLADGVAGLRIGIPKEYFSDDLDPKIAKIIKDAIDVLQGLGATTIEISLPHTEYAVPAYYIIAPAEASSNLSRYDGLRFGHRAKATKDLNDLYCKSRSEGFGHEVQRRILIGNFVLSQGYYDAFYRRAQKVRTLIARDFESAFSEHCDIIACPTTPSSAFEIGAKTADPIAMYLNDIFTVPASLAGLPALSLPCGLDAKGLPVGLQLIGKPWDEQSLLNAAYSYEQATEWHKLKAEQ